jgi:hypothetical protein
MIVIIWYSLHPPKNVFSDSNFVHKRLSQFPIQLYLSTLLLLLIFHPLCSFSSFLNSGIQLLEP